MRFLRRGVWGEALGPCRVAITTYLSLSEEQACSQGDRLVVWSWSGLACICLGWVLLNQYQRILIYAIDDMMREKADQVLDYTLKY